MTNEKRDWSHWLKEQARLPRWIVFVLFLSTLFNTIIFLSLVSALWRPDYIPAPLSQDIVLGLHLQLFEAFLAALAIALAVFGFVGYAAIRESAERRAEEAARTFMQGYARVTNESQVGSAETIVEKPDLSGLKEGIPADRQPEDKI